MNLIGFYIPAQALAGRLGTPSGHFGHQMQRFGSIGILKTSRTCILKTLKLLHHTWQIITLRSEETKRPNPPRICFGGLQITQRKQTTRPLQEFVLMRWKPHKCCGVVKVRLLLKRECGASPGTLLRVLQYNVLQPPRLTL